MKKIEEIIDELRQWEKEGKGRAVAVAALDPNSGVHGNIGGRGMEEAGAIACILKNAEDNGLLPRVIMKLYEEIEVRKKEKEGNERYS